MGTASFGAATPPSNIAEYLKTPTGTVYIASNTPVVGQVLIATSATNATWQTPSAYTTINDLRIQGNTTNTATAAGTLSIAMGRNTYAGGTNSITLGPNTVSGTSTSVIVGNSCLTVARTAAGDGDSCVIVGSGSTLSNTGGPGSGATFDYNISIGANNQSLYQAGNSRICNNNTLVGPRNTLTLAHNNHFRRNFMFTQGHDITTSNAHSAEIQDNIIMGREGSYTSDGTMANNNVVIGTVPRWSGCNSSVIIGPTNNAAVKTSVIIGSANNVPATAGTNLFLIGNNANITGTSTNCILIGQGVGALSAADSICIGYGAGASATNCIVMGKGSTSSGAGSIVLGDLAAYSTKPTCVVIGSVAVAEGAGSSSICIGTNAYSSAGTTVSVGNSASTFATNGIAVGNGAVVGASSTGSTAVGNSAVISPSTANAMQLGTGTNNTATSLQFRSHRIHDGATTGTNQFLYKEAATGHYKPTAGTYNTTLNTATAPYYGVVAGITSNPNMTVFADYDTYYDRVGSKFTAADGLTGISNAVSFLYRDGINFVQGYPTGQGKINGWDEEWGCNVQMRYGSCLSDKDNDRIFIPIAVSPLSHYCHMELTITAMRVNFYNEGTMNWVPGGGITAGAFDVDASLEGGKTWSGVAGCVTTGGGDIWIPRVTTSFGGAFASSDLSPAIRSTGGVCLAGYWCSNPTNLDSPATNSITTVAVPTTNLPSTTGTLYVGGDGCGFSWFSTDVNGFGDYTVPAIGAIKRAFGGTGRSIIGVVVKGKLNHRIDWRVMAKCTFIPYADPSNAS